MNKGRRTVAAVLSEERWSKCECGKTLCSGCVLRLILISCYFTQLKLASGSAYNHIHRSGMGILLKHSVSSVCWHVICVTDIWRGRMCSVGVSVMFVFTSQFLMSLCLLLFFFVIQISLYCMTWFIWTWCALVLNSIKLTLIRNTDNTVLLMITHYRSHKLSR